MSEVPSNLIPTRITQLPIAPVASEESILVIVYEGNNYQIRAGDLLSVAGVPTSRQVIAGTGLTGGGALSENVTLSVAVGGIGNTQLSATGVSAGVYGDATNIPVFTVNAQGRVTAATTIPVVVSGYVPVTREVIAGTGLTGGGPLNANVTLDANLSNTTPLAGDGLGNAGIETSMSRSDHQHPSVNLQSDNEISGVLGLSHGGTAKSIVPDEGAIIWCGNDGLYVGPVGTAGQVLQSTGVNEYIWVNQSSLDVGQADYLNGGAANRIAYQTGFGVTGFLSAPSITDTFLGWDGSNIVWTALPGGGTVTSVGLAMPTSEFTVTNSPVTSSGTLTAAWKTQTANKVFAGPTTGAAATPTFRSMVNADLPDSGVTPDTYGSSTQIPVITVNSKGVVTGVSNTTIVGTLNYQGAWDASTNTPTLTSSVGTSGYYYAVSVAGNTNLNGITDWQIGDWAIFNGSVWQKIDQTNAVTSVNGLTGAVTLTYSSVGAPSTTGTNATGIWAIDISGNAATATTAGSVTNSVTFNSSGTGGASPQTYNGGSAITVSRNTLGAAASGANTDITSESGLTGGISTPSFIQFNTSPTVTPAQGMLWFDGNTTLNLQMTANVDGSINEDQFLYVKASSTIAKGDLCMFNGTDGASGHILAIPATGLTVAQYIIGVAAETIATGDFGLVQVAGKLSGINTSGSSVGETWANGDVLYYNSAYAGGLTKVYPASGPIVIVAAVLYAHSGSTGILTVRPTFTQRITATSPVSVSQTSSGAAISLGTVTTANGGTGLTSYTAGDLVYYSTGTALSKLGLGTTNYVLTAGASAPQYVAQSTLSVGSATTATTATNVAGGATGSIVYQTGAGATSTLALGTTNYVLTAGASAPQYVAQSTLSVGSATTATNATNVAVTSNSSDAADYIPFVAATTGNTPVLVNSSLTFNASTAKITGGIGGGTF